MQELNNTNTGHNWSVCKMSLYCHISQNCESRRRRDEDNNWKKYWQIYCILQQNI